MVYEVFKETGGKKDDPLPLECRKHIVNATSEGMSPCCNTSYEKHEPGLHFGRPSKHYEVILATKWNQRRFLRGHHFNSKKVFGSVLEMCSPGVPPH